MALSARRIARVCSMLSLGVVIHRAPLRAQSPAALDTAHVPRRTPVTGARVAVARGQLLKSRVGRLHDRDLYVVGVRRRWPVAVGRRASLAYSVDFLPAVLSTGMPEEYSLSCHAEVCVLSSARSMVYGVGLAPVGLQARMALTPRLGLVTGADGGMVWFARAVPDPDERRLNFSLDGRAGLELRVARELILTVGYRFNHISNGGAGPVNPGMNSHMFELGVARADH
jgi:hypothetical protein